MDLKLVQSNSDNDRYLDLMTNTLKTISNKLLFHDVWDHKVVSSIPQFKNEHVGVRRPIYFDSLEEPIQLELKLYWAKLLIDPRNNSRSIIERRRSSMDWLNECWPKISNKFGGVSFLSDIPHPEFPKDWMPTPDSIENESNNRLLIEEFSKKLDNLTRPTQKAEWIKNGELVEKEYVSPRITIIGDFHKKTIMYREQFESPNKRKIVYLNDLYSEQDSRFSDSQQRDDWYINFYTFPKWMQDAVRSHIYTKVENGELGPLTLRNYFGSLKVLRDFLYEKFDSPTPSVINNSLIGDDFIAWGNEKKLSGKNWYTNNYAFLTSAAADYPDKWPALSVNTRVTRKIEKTHYKQGLGRIGHNKEGAGRSYSQNIIDQLASAIKKAPHPVYEIFSLIVSTGMRAEDGHAVLFDCLQEDVSDPDFMILTFWQNKVRSWNTKPLSKSNKDHAFLIQLIKNVKDKIVKTYEKQTKYLFPTFTGTKESYIRPARTLSEIKKLCLENQILDDEGNPLNFSWHPLRHTKGTSMAAEGHDVLTIMMELGHASPDMATMYVNNRLELKKRALLDKGSGRFFTIEGEVDEKLGELLVRKAAITATRVCGGACSMPAQIGDWCEHANACYTCKHFRADEKDVEFFKVEKVELERVVDEQIIELKELKEAGKTRMSEIVSKRVEKNKQVCQSLNKIVNAIESKKTFSGSENKFKPVQLDILIDER